MQELDKSSTVEIISDGCKEHDTILKEIVEKQKRFWIKFMTMYKSQRDTK
jgi:hypothetical protein